MTENKEFAKGIYFKRPTEGSPEWVKGKMSIKLDEAIAFLKEAEGEWMNLDLLQSKDGTKLYFAVNTWKPETKAEYPENNLGPSPL